MDQDGVLRKLAKGGVLKRGAAGRCVLGKKAVAESVVAALVGEGLLRPLAEGRYDLSALGRSRAAGLAKAAGSGAARQETFRAQHQIRERASLAGGGEVVVNRAESPLGWLRRHKDARGRAFLDERQAEAGERLRCDFELAGLGPRVTSVWSGVPAEGRRLGGHDLTPTERQVAARQRLHRALDVLGGEMGDVALRVCCFLEGLEAVEARQGWPARSGKVVLAIALSRLASHYGLAGRGVEGEYNQIG